jgi:release factor glutamine methyltransferase
MTTREALRSAEERLRNARVTEYEADARILLAHALDDTLSHLPTRLRDAIEEPVQERYEQLIDRRVKREPLAYITGEAEFMGLSFKSDARALVPRPSTETLVEVVLENAKAQFTQDADDPLVVADVGTGCGCIAISLAHALPYARVWGTDVSAEALELARENAALNHVEDRVEFLHGSDLEPLVEAGVAEDISVLVSNPPYVTTGQLTLLDPQVIAHEPQVALLGGKTGLSFYERVLPGLRECLPACRLVGLEFGLAQEDLVGELVATHLPGWHTELHRDLLGIERIIVALRTD